MTGKEFRALAGYGVEQCAKFLDEFPDLDVELKINGKFGTVTVGLDSGAGITMVDETDIKGDYDG